MVIDDCGTRDFCGNKLDEDRTREIGAFEVQQAGGL